MALTNKTRKLVHRKRWENVCVTPTNSAAGSFFVADKLDLIPNSLAFYIANYSSIWRYDGDQDSFLQLPNSGIAGTFGAGACGEFRALGAMGGVFDQTATGGGVGFINTNKNIVRDLGGNEAKPIFIRVIKGTGLGFEGYVSRNLIGANSTIYVKNLDGSPATETFSATTVFHVFSGSLWVQGAGASAGFAVWDLATSAWTQRTPVGVTWGTDGQLVSTIGLVADFATGTATAGAATTITDIGGSKAWLTNQWANYQVHITGGTGKGQIREIASNTGSVITITAAWDVNPDTTSTYAIEGNYNQFFLAGNGAVTLYRYKPSTNTWTTLAPTAARAAVMGAGGSLNWIDGVELWDLQANGAPNALTATLYRQNGRYLFSFRGGATNALDVYDIAANTWISNVAYGNQNETFTTGSSSLDYAGMIYVLKENQGRIFRFNIKKFQLESFSLNPQPQGTTVVGTKLFMLPYKEGATELNFLYNQAHTSNIMHRILLIDNNAEV